MPIHLLAGCGALSERVPERGGEPWRPSARVGPRRACDVEQRADLLGVEVESDTRETVCPKRSTANGFRAGSAHEQSGAAVLTWPRTHRAHALGDLLPTP